MAQGRTLASLLVVALLSCFAGCATPPSAPPPDTSKTFVILLPDEDGHVGALAVRSAAGSQDVTEAYRSAAVIGTGAPVPGASQLAKRDVESTYGDVLKAHPTKPLSIVLYFVLDRTQLTAESVANLPALYDAVESRKPTEITVIGHADATGSEEANVKLSAARARAIADLILKHDPRVGPLEVKFFGDKDPLVPAPPHVPEPRNRRVEVLIL